VPRSKRAFTLDSVGGLKPRRRWELEEEDFQFLEKLSPEDRAWLDAFNRGMHDDDHRRSPIAEDRSYRRECTARNNAANRSVLEDARVHSALDVLGGDLDSGAVVDVPVGFVEASALAEPVPAYLNSDDYKAKLAEFRANLPGDNKNKRTRHWQKTKTQLLALTQAPDPMIGRVCGAWTILAGSGSKAGKLYFSCRCDCGVIRDVRGSELRTGQSRSCGCLSHSL
jgi:hypothetical protein